MENWSEHHFYKTASEKLSPQKVVELLRYVRLLRAKQLPVIFNLHHLAKITKCDYKTLRQTVKRNREAADYRLFRVAKRKGGYRHIHAVTNPLFGVQQFINSEILQKIVPHRASFAFHRSGGIRECAAQHCGARWVFRFDLKDFFYAITEIDAYEVFHGLGYCPLLSFELARLCTTTRVPNASKRHTRPTVERMLRVHDYKIYTGPVERIGVLPQGAPTSPMLSNLVCKRLDETLSGYAEEVGLIYTRYADDLTFSAFDLPPNFGAGKIHNHIVGLIRRSGFIENKEKTRIQRPGSRKVVLGLVVDGLHPRLHPKLNKRIDLLLYSARKFGVDNAADHFGFDSALGFYHHVQGLIAYVKHADPKCWIGFAERFNLLRSPLYV